MNAAVDVREVLSHVNVPTLVLVRAGARMPHGATDVDAAAESRWIADRLPNAVLAELPGIDYLPWVGEPDALIDELATFVTGTRPVPELTRVLVTLLFTDVVDSTSRLSKLGDARWQDLLSRHNDAVRGVLSRYRGQEIDRAGDGFLATFDGPARAVRAAEEIVSELAALGLAVRCGLHTGEVEIGHDGISGIAVHIGARVAALAGAGEVLVTRTVRDLTAGAGLTFRERGPRELRGVGGEFEIFAVSLEPPSDPDD